MDLFHDYGTLLKFEGQGTASTTITNGNSANIDYTLTENIYLIGIDYRCIAFNDDDRVSFQVVHPVAGLITQFATDLYLRSQMYYRFNRAKIPSGLIIRVVYDNNGPSDSKFNFNIEKYVDET